MIDPENIDKAKTRLEWRKSRMDVLARLSNNPSAVGFRTTAGYNGDVIFDDAPEFKAAIALLCHAQRRRIAKLDAELTDLGVDVAKLPQPPPRERADLHALEITVGTIAAKMAGLEPAAAPAGKKAIPITGTTGITSLVIKGLESIPRNEIEATTDPWDPRRPFGS